jgi:peptide/nickel transport system permease protein
MTGLTISRQRARRRLRPARYLPDDRLLLAMGIVCAALVLAAILAPVLAPYSPSQTDILNQNLGPSSAHLLGTDALGRDILSRLLYGARLSLLGPALVTIIAATAGTTLAIASVWVGGALDRAVSRMLDVLFAFPGLIVAVLAVAIFGQGLLAPVLALSVAYLPYVARVVRSVALRERHMAYIDACRSLGYSGWRISAHHIFPNVRLMVGAQATISFAGALMDLAAISFIGLGVQPPASDWGLMVNDGSSALLNSHPMLTLAAGGAIVLTVVVFNVLGDRLSAAFEVTR